jgi:hypothetical protein
MGEGQQNYSADQKQCLPRELRQVVAEHGLEHRRVRGQSARQLASPALGEKSRRQMNEVGEQLLAQLCDDQL